MLRLSTNLAHRSFQDISSDSSTFLCPYHLLHISLTHARIDSSASSKSRHYILLLFIARQGPSLRSTDVARRGSGEEGMP